MASQSVGENRGVVATRLLVEMNHEVRGDAVEDSPEDILRNKPDFFKSFSLVIAADVGEKSLRRLSEVLWEGRVPLMVVRDELYKNRSSGETDSQ